MGTDNERMQIVEAQTLGDVELQRMVDFSAEELLDALEAALSADTGPIPQEQTSFVLGPPAALTSAGATGAPSTLLLSATSGASRRVAGYVQGQIVTWANPDPGFASIPFDNNTGATYYIGLRLNDFPSSVTAQAQITGGFVYDKVTRGVGEQLVPTLVTKNPGGAGTGLRFTVASALLAQWNNAVASRPATVWLVDPVTSAADAIYTGVLEVIGGVLVVDSGAGNYLGDSEAGSSTTPADYLVQVHGLTVTTQNLTSFVTGSRLTYLVLGTIDVTGPTILRTAQNVVPSLQESSTSGTVFEVFRKAFRAGARLGTSVETRDWNDPSNVVVNSGVDPVTITFGAVLGTRAFIFTGQQTGSTPLEPRLCSIAAAGGLVATLAKAAASGVYHIVAEYEMNGGVPNYKLSVLSNAAWTALGDEGVRRLLHVYQFTFTTGTGAVAGGAGDNLLSARGIADGSILSMTGPTPTDDHFPTIGIVELDDDVFRLRVRDAIGTVFTKDTGLLFQRNMGGAPQTKLWVVPVTGEAGNLDAAVVAAAQEQAEFRLGGPNDYNFVAKHDGAARFLDCSYAGGFWARHQATGGNAVDTTGRMRFEDFILNGTNGKLIEVQSDISSGQGDAAWLYVPSHAGAGHVPAGHSVWELPAENTRRRLHIPFPQIRLEPGAAFRVEQCQISFSADWVSTSLTLDGTIFTQEFVPDAPPTNPPTTITKTTRGAETTGAMGADTSAFLLIDSGASTPVTPWAPTVNGRTYLELSNDPAAGTDGSFFILSVMWRLRVYEFTG